jgi:hypothetical protein
MEKGNFMLFGKVMQDFLFLKAKVGMEHICRVHAALRTVMKRRIGAMQPI